MAKRLRRQVGGYAYSHVRSPIKARFINLLGRNSKSRTSTSSSKRRSVSRFFLVIPSDLTRHLLHIAFSDFGKLRVFKLLPNDVRWTTRPH